WELPTLTSSAANIRSRSLTQLSLAEPAYTKQVRRTKVKSLPRGLKFALIAGLVVTAVGIVRVGQTLHAESAGTNTQPVAGPEVKIDNFSFTPGNLTVPVGT